EALLGEEVDVVEEELAAVGEGHDAGGAAGGEVFGLRENPGIAQNAAAHQDAVDASGTPGALETVAVPHPGHHVFRLETIAAAEHGNREAARDLGDEIPIGRSAVALRGGPPVHGH